MSVILKLENILIFIRIRILNKQIEKINIKDWLE